MYSGKVVEEADVVTLFTNPKHPYTQGLMKSVPSLDVKTNRLYSIKGNVPIPGSLRSGCTFAPRCEFAMEICRQKIPELVEVENGHFSRCWLNQSEKEGLNNEAAIG
jgi:peptide/nickel transport system ATP-binding protein